MVMRISTGILGFDKLVQGGLPKGSITLICGTPGTGKSIFCAQVVYYNALKGKKCLYLNLEQDDGRLQAQMRQFGWDPQKVKRNLKIVHVNSSDPALVAYVLDEIHNHKYDIIALDSLDSISSTPMDVGEIGKIGMEKVVETVVPTILDVPTVGRIKLKKIFNAIAKAKATALLTSERVQDSPGYSRDTISEFLCDVVIVLHAVQGEEGFRTLHIPKSRLTKQRSGIYSFEMGKKGIVVKESE